MRLILPFTAFFSALDKAFLLFYFRSKRHVHCPSYYKAWEGTAPPTGSVTCWLLHPITGDSDLSNQTADKHLLPKLHFRKRICPYLWIRWVTLQSDEALPRVQTEWPHWQSLRTCPYLIKNNINLHCFPLSSPRKYAVSSPSFNVFFAMLQKELIVKSTFVMAHCQSLYLCVLGEFAYTNKCISIADVFWDLISTWIWWDCAWRARWKKRSSAGPWSK